MFYEFVRHSDKESFLIEAPNWGEAIKKLNDTTSNFSLSITHEDPNKTVLVNNRREDNTIAVSNIIVESN